MAKVEMELPYELGLRTLLDNVSYSNPLPMLFQAPVLDFERILDELAEQVTRYMGDDIPLPPITLRLPKAGAGSREWTLPSINDQIIIQSCVSHIATDLYSRLIDSTRVFSYQINQVPERIALHQDQLRSWIQFQDATREKCQSERCILQLDIADSFKSISRDQVKELFLRNTAHQRTVELVDKLINGISGGPGLPMVNDSIFFLGNIYLSVVDQIIAEVTPNFLRFVDDYRIFGDSRTQLERFLNSISARLAASGFRLNDQKTAIGTTEQYLQAISQVRFAITHDVERDSLVDEPMSGYISSTVFMNELRPEDMLSQVLQPVASQPYRLLTEGFGRQSLASIRRMYEAGNLADLGNYYSSPLNELIQSIEKQRSFVERIETLLFHFGSKPTEAWRTIWLLYIVPLLPDSKRLAAIVDRIYSRSVTPVLVKLWCRLAQTGIPFWPAPGYGPDMKSLFRASYVDAAEEVVGQFESGKRRRH